ncbi:MAG: hypothetical protein SF053_00735 [Bacteroidia bacterium]|nr:hypothetical protein [Bacteroidia bacterium]
MRCIPWISWLLLAGVAYACTYVPGTQTCPPAPVLADLGSPAPRISVSTVNIDISQSYVREKVRALVGTPHSAPNGVDAGMVQLSQPLVNGQPVNRVSIVIEPWLKGAADTAVSLQRSYELRLRLVPYLITPQTMPDAAQRTALLCPAGGTCTATSGVLIRFEFEELISRIHQAPVVCGSPQYDLIDGQVLKGLFESLGNSKPLVLPSEPVEKIVSSLAGTPVALTGVVLGSDLDLKVGLLFDTGTPRPFDANTWLSMYPNTDWGISVDTSLVAAAVRRSAIASATATDPRVQVNNVRITFERDGFGIQAAGQLNVCGGIPFTVTTSAQPQICLDAAGRADLRVCAAKTETTPKVSFLQGICYLGAQFIESFSGGMATAVIRDGVSPCPSMSIVTFGAGPGDTFYGTATDTDGVFYLVGRSTFMDEFLTRAGAPRTPAPARCP